MNRIWALAVGALLVAAAPQDKRELRYAFTKGETFPYVLKYSIGIRLEKVPEAFQGILGDEPLVLQMDGRLDVLVKETAADGSAVLEGVWKTLKAKGHVTTSDVDFDYDAEKKPGDKPAKKAEPQDPALDGVLNTEDQLRRTVAEPLLLSADAFGRLSIKAEGGRAQEFEGVFRSLNGLMGPLPAAAVAKGDVWKEQTKVSIPTGTSTVDVGLSADCAYEADEDVRGRSCAVLKSKFKVGQVEKKNDPDNVFNIQFKTAGEGEGRTWFSAKEGRALKTQSSLKVRVDAVIPNPGGGDDLEIKAVVKMDQSGELGK